MGHGLAHARRDWPLLVNNGCRTVRPSTIRLRCCVAWHMAASPAACGLDCVISEHHGSLERHVTKIIADNTFETFTFNSHRCWPSSASRHPVCRERLRHTMRGGRCSFSSETGDNQIAWHLCANIRCLLERRFIFKDSYHFSFQTSLRRAQRIHTVCNFLSLAHGH